MMLLLLQYGGFYGRAVSPMARILALLLGVGLLFNSLRGLLSREGIYDEQSRRQMLLSGWLGAVAGLGLIVWGLGLFVSLG